MLFTCVTCKTVAEPSRDLQSKQRKAVVICAPCVRASMTAEELHELLNPPTATA